MKDSIILPAELNINYLQDLLEKVKAIISSDDNIVLDACNVESMDALGIQLIISIQKTAQLNNVKFKLINPSDKLQKYLKNLSLICEVE